MTNASSTLPADSPVLLSDALIQELSAIPLLSSLGPDQFRCLEPLELINLPSGTILAKAGEAASYFWILLEGGVEVLDLQTSGHEYVAYTHQKGAAFGEVPLLANIPTASTLRTQGVTRLLRFDENAFWNLMNACPEVRQAILRNMAYRLQKTQHYTVQQEKMAALGTLAAGLMHELNNPGAAARRAASQLRANFVNFQEISTRFNHCEMSREQKDCLQELKERALHNPPSVLNSIEQSDAEETLAVWLENASVPNAWRIAPTLVAVGVKSGDMECALHAFPAQTFADTVTWIDAIISSTQLVTTIEESIGRVTELVKSVKSYAYEGSGQLHSVDLNESVHAALVILGHKLREKQVILTKEFAPDLSPLRCTCKGLNQVWTNLIDNAIDAVKPGGAITVKTWGEQVGDKSFLCFRITDNGEGVPADLQPRIFDPFFTTKAPGVGTGLGLGIVHRLIEQSMGSLHFSSEPGNTTFEVRLPSQ